MIGHPKVISFVVRCTSLVDINEREPVWRITVSHVQEEEEVSVTTLDEVYEYMKTVMDR